MAEKKPWWAVAQTTTSNKRSQTPTSHRSGRELLLDSVDDAHLRRTTSKSASPRRTAPPTVQHTSSSSSSSSSHEKSRRSSAESTKSAYKRDSTPKKLELDTSSETEPVGLPHEIWGHIISFLDVNTAVRLHMVNQFWQSYLWKHLASIDFKRRKKVPKNVIGKLIRQVAHSQVDIVSLRELKVDAAKLTINDTLATFYYLPQLVGLRKLHMINLGMAKVNMAKEQFCCLTALTNLVSLDLTNNSQLDEILVYIPKLKSLERLYLKESSKRRNNPIVGVKLGYLSTLSNLKILQLIGFRNVEKQYFHFLTVLTNLENLAVVDCPRATDTLLHTLSKLTNLTVLKYSEHQSTLISPLENIRYSKQLKKLAISYGHHLGDKQLFNISYLANLTCLRISCCPCLSAEGIEMAIAGLPNLTLLHVRWCTRVRSLKFLRVVPQLTVLDIGGLVYLEDKEMQYLRHLFKLKSLNIARNEMITDAALNCITHLTTLVHLNVSSCRNLTSKGISQLSVLTNLLTLNISDCYGISTHKFLLPFWKKKLLPQLPQLTIITDSVDNIDLAGYIFKARLTFSGL